MMNRACHELAVDASFLQELLRQLRAQASDGAWDGKSDPELLAPFILPRARRRDVLLPFDDGPDPDVFLRIELFHNAVGHAIQARTGVACETMLKMHHEGFGRLVLLAGRLVVVNRFLRDVQRFSFDSLEKLVAAGERLVGSGVTMIERFPEASRLT